MKFTLEIKLGNDAMQTYGDIATNLRRQAASLDSLEEAGEAFAPQAERVRDTNGNTVGKWEVTE